MSSLSLRETVQQLLQPLPVQTHKVPLQKSFMPHSFTCLSNSSLQYRNILICSQVAERGHFSRRRGLSRRKKCLA